MSIKHTSFLNKFAFLRCPTLVLFGALVMHWSHNWFAVGALALVAAGLSWHQRAAPNLSPEDAVTSTTASAQSLPLHVLPVWNRNMQSAKAYSESSMESLLVSFTSISGYLEQALNSIGNTSLTELGNPEELLSHHQVEIDAVLASTRRATQTKDNLLQSVLHLEEGLSNMTALTKEIQMIGRATHLLALNASVEATRAGSSGGGFAVVAHEVRELASQSRQAGKKLAKHVTEMRERIETVTTESKKEDTDDDELKRQAMHAAHQLLNAVAGSLSSVSTNSLALREASMQVQKELEKVSVGLQSQDRLSQMLESVMTDMSRLLEWLKGKPDTAAQSATTWLQRLEQNYTMEDMRAAFHGNVSVQKSTTVEFF